MAMRNKNSQLKEIRLRAHLQSQTKFEDRAAEAEEGGLQQKESCC